MKAKYLLIASLALAATLPLQAKSPKRGVSESSFQYKAQMSAIEPGVTWYYNWGNTAGINIADFEGMEYVPMCWSGNYSAENIRNFVKEHPGTQYLLGFNEPNFTAQANMTPAEAAEKWPEVQALAKELGLKLVAPALNYSPNPPYTDPLRWMDEFVAIVGPDAFDYTAIHSYGGFGVMKTLAENFHNKYGKDVWVTEFCYWPNEGDGNSLVTPESQIACMMESLEWLEKTEWIHRYAWFKAIGNSNSSKGPNYGLLLSGKGEEPRELSQQGHVYVNMPTFDPDLYHSVGEEVSAADYAAQKNALLGTGSHPGNPKPIEISRFNAGAQLDYQFDVPADDDYVLTLMVSGQGEPARFDPNVAVCAVNADDSDGEELHASKTFTLSGDDAKYAPVYFPVKLKAGKQTIRIKDTNAFRPSGMRIATLNLSTLSGVGTVGLDSDVPVNVYSLQGFLIRENADPAMALDGLPAGVYIVGGKKFVKK